MDWLPRADTSVAEAALRYAEHGFNPLLLHGIDQIHGGCTCQQGPECGKSAGKHPVSSGWQNQHRDPSRTRREFNLATHPNVGLVMGGDGRLIALDLDGPQALESLTALESALGPLPETLTSVSGRIDGGQHRIFQVPDHLDLKKLGNSASKIAPGIDVRASGGQIVVAPSMHHSGRRYRWANNLAPALLPEAWYRKLSQRHPANDTGTGRAPTAEDVPTLEAACERLRAAVETTRNNTLFQVACQVARLGIDPDALTDTALAIGLTPFETKRTIASARKRAAADVAAKETAGVQRALDSLKTPSQITQTSREDAQAQTIDAITNWQPGEAMGLELPCGGGKNHSLRSAAAAEPERRYLVGAPTYDLTTQGTNAATRLGVSAEVREGVLRPKHADGTPKCQQFDRASVYQANGGSVSRDMCLKCSYRKGCEALGKDHGSTYVGTHHSLVKPLAKKFEDSEAKRLTVPIYDECPELFSLRTITPEDLEWFDNMLSDQEMIKRKHCVLSPNVGHRLQPWVAVLRTALTNDEPIVDSLRAASDAYLTNELTSAWIPRAERVATSYWDERVKQYLIDPKLTEQFAQLISDYGGDTLARVRVAAGSTITRESSWLANPEELHGTADLAQAARVDRIARMLVDAALAKTLRRSQSGTVGIVFVQPTDAAKQIRQHGGIVMDATLPLVELRVLRPDIKLLQLDVPDGAPGTVRILRYTSDSTRRALVPAGKPAWERIEPLLRDGLERAAAAGVKKLLVGGYREIIEPLKTKTAPVFILEALEGWPRFRELDLVYYGNVRGLDDWTEFDGFLSIAEHRPPTPSLIAIAEELGVDSKELGKDRARAESAQFHGRARDPGRTTPAWHCHIGSLAPAGWTEANTTIIRAAQGRPKTAIENVAELAKQLAARCGSQNAAARAAGVPPTTFKRALQGTSTAQVADMIHKAVRSFVSGPQTPYRNTGSDGSFRDLMDQPTMADTVKPKPITIPPPAIAAIDRSMRASAITLDANGLLARLLLPDGRELRAKVPVPILEIRVLP